MSKRWRCKEQVGLTIGNEGDSSVMVCVEARREEEKWKSVIEQSGELTSVDGVFSTSREAIIAALNVVVRDLNAALMEARRELSKAKCEEVKP